MIRCLLGGHGYVIFVKLQSAMWNVFDKQEPFTGFASGLRFLQLYGNAIGKGQLKEHGIGFGVPIGVLDVPVEPTLIRLAHGKRLQMVMTFEAHFLL